MMDSKSIVLEIEKVRLKSESYMDAILTVCEKYNIGDEEITSMLGPILKQKLEVECKRNNLIKNDNTATLDG